MDSEAFTEKENYQLKSNSGDLLKFTNLRPWRRVLIEEEIPNPHNVDDNKLVKSILKFSLLIYNDTTINQKTYNNNPEFFKEIVNKLKANDVYKFAEIFLENHNYLFKNLDESELKYIQQENNPVLKIHYLWNFEFDKQQKWLKNTLGFETGSLSEEVSEAMRRDDTLYHQFYGSHPSFDFPILNNQPQIDYGLQIQYFTTSLQEIFKSQIELYKSTQEQLKLSNQYLKEQLENSIENSKKIDKTSKRSLFISIFMFIVAISSLYFAYQTFHNSMKLSQKLYIPMLKIYGMHEKASLTENNIIEINSSLMLYNYGLISAEEVRVKCNYYNKQILIMEREYPTDGITIFPHEDWSIPINEKLQIFNLEDLIVKVEIIYTGINNEQFSREFSFNILIKRKKLNQ